MFAYALRRIIQFVPTIFFITVIIFILLNVLPGDATLMSGNMRKQMDAETAKIMRAKLGLDLPLHVRYYRYMKDLLRGDLGKSFLRRENVSKLIGERMWPTLKLAIVSMIIAVGIGIPLGFFSALKQGTWLDTASMIGAVSGISLPQFWLGLLLMYLFAVKMLRWLPPQGYGDGELHPPHHALLHPGGGLHGPAGPDHPGGGGRGPDPGLHPDRQGQGVVRAPKVNKQARLQEHHDPGPDHGRAPVRGSLIGQTVIVEKALLLARHRLPSGGLHLPAGHPRSPRAAS